MTNTAPLDPNDNSAAPSSGRLTLTLPDGRTGTVAVDQGFAALSPDQQHATVEEIARSLSPDSGFGADLQAGAHTAMDTTGAALQGVGGIMDRNSIPGASYVSGAGDWLRKTAPQMPAGYHGRGGDILQDIGQGNFSRAAGDVIHGIVEGAPIAAGAIGTGAALDAVGLPAAAGAALVGGINGLGAGAEARASAAGRSAPNTEDVVGALPRASVDAIASGATFGRLPVGVAGRVATGVVAGAGQSAADQYDATGHVDPAQIANAGITTGATVGASELPGVAAWGAKAATDNLMARTLDAPATQADQLSVMRVKADMDAIRANAVQSGGVSPPDTAVANSVKAEYASKLNGIAQGWLRSGLIDRDDYRDLSVLVNNQALRHNNTIAEGNDELPTLFAQVDALDGVPDSARAVFKDGVRDLNTISTQSFTKNTVGPVQRVAQFAGTWGPAAGSLMAGNPLAAATAAMGHGVTGKIAGAVGAKIDQALGLNTPPVVLQAINATRALKKAGVDVSAIQGSLPALQGASGRSMPTSSVTGLPSNTVPVNAPVPPGWQINPSIGPAGYRPTPPSPGPATSPAAPSALRVNTPSDVALAQALAMGGPIDPVTAARLGASIRAIQGDSQKPAEAPGAVSATALQGQHQVTPAAPPGPSVGTFTPASRYIANSVPGLDHESAVRAAREAEAAGVVPPGTAALVDRSPAPLDAGLLDAIKGHALSAIGIQPAQASAVVPGGWAVDRSAQARVNAAQYQANARALAQANPDIAGTILTIAQGAKTPEAKTALARAFYVQHPESIGRLPKWLLDHGNRSAP